MFNGNMADLFVCLQLNIREYYYFLCLCTSVNFVQVFKHVLVQNVVTKEDLKKQQQHVKIDNLEEKKKQKKPSDCFRLNKTSDVKFLFGSAANWNWKQ